MISLIIWVMQMSFISIFKTVHFINIVIWEYFYIFIMYIIFSFFNPIMSTRVRQHNTMLYLQIVLDHRQRWLCKGIDILCGEYSAASNRRRAFRSPPIWLVKTNNCIGRSVSFQLGDLCFFSVLISYLFLK